MPGLPWLYSISSHPIPYITLWIKLCLFLSVHVNVPTPQHIDMPLYLEVVFPEAVKLNEVICVGFYSV